MEKFKFFLRGHLSQWYKEEDFIDEEGDTYNCCEQYMMAKKALLFHDMNTYSKIMATKSPREQKRLGRLVKDFNQVIWDKNAQEIVYRGNMLKFVQCEEARKVLFATAGKTLVEANPNDSIWGIGLSEYDPDRLDRATWKGKNWLGEILTRIRDELM